MSLLASCTVGPDYVRPPAEVPPAFKEVGNWQPGQPRDVIDRGAWWSVYQDPVLDGLERQVEINNQNLRASEAAYRQAAAAVQAASAAFFPTLTANGSATRSQSAGVSGGRGTSSKQVIRNSFDLSGSVSWEIDLWGRIRRSVENSEATAQASAADLAGARLSAQATLASNYLTLRAQDELKRLLDASTDAYAQSLQITRNQYAAGIAARSDVAQAQTLLDQTRAQAIAVGVQRAQLEHAIAVLVGKPPAEFSIEPVPGLPRLPAIPPGLPSTLLERRPDIAGAERRMAAANAQIGVAVAAFYPSLTLSGSYGYSSLDIGQLLRASNNIWSVGPQLAQTLFDGGLRRAQEAEARAAYDQTTAEYRQTVLTGFQQVEDQLAALRILGQQAEVQANAVASAQEAERLILNQYKAGTVAYTSVVTAQTAALSNEQTALTLRQNQLTSSVTLIQALGGGWDATELPAIGGTREDKADALAKE